MVYSYHLLLVTFVLWNLLMWLASGYWGCHLFLELSLILVLGKPKAITVNSFNTASLQLFHFVTYYNWLVRASSKKALIIGMVTLLKAPNSHVFFKLLTMIIILTKLKDNSESAVVYKLSPFITYERWVIRRNTTYWCSMNLSITNCHTLCTTQALHEQKWEAGENTDGAHKVPRFPSTIPSAEGWSLLKNI